MTDRPIHRSRVHRLRSVATNLVWFSAAAGVGALMGVLLAVLAAGLVSAVRVMV